MCVCLYGCMFVCMFDCLSVSMIVLCVFCACKPARKHTACGIVRGTLTGSGMNVNMHFIKYSFVATENSQ